MKQFDRTTVILAGALGFILLVSGISYFIWGNEKEEQVLFFPEYRSGGARGEARILPRKDTKEQEIKLLVKEVLLGPFDINYTPVAPADTRIRSLLLRKDSLYIDFSVDIVFKEATTSLSLEESLEYISRSIRFNFPGVKKIVYSINGNQLQLSRESTAE